MLIDIKESKKLKEMKRKTRMTTEELVNQILMLHLDEKRRRKYLRHELDRLFSLYRKKHNSRR